MDQDAFRETYRDVNERFCAFEKGVLTNQCKCSRAEKFCIAEREGVHCTSDEGQTQCLQLLDLLREQARFALKTSTTPEKRLLPHGKAIRIQIGGLRGLQLVLTPEQETPRVIEDVFELINQARGRFGDLTALPFPQIMQQIAAYRGKTRARRRDR